MGNIHTTISHKKSSKLQWMFNNEILLLQNLFLFICEFIPQSRNDLLVNILTIHPASCQVFTSDHSDAAIHRGSIKYMFLKIFWNSQEITHIKVLLKKTLQHSCTSVSFVKFLSLRFQILHHFYITPQGFCFDHSHTRRHKSDCKRQNKSH